MNRLLLLAIILLVIAGMMLLWLSNRWIEQRLEGSGRAAITFLVVGENGTERLTAPTSLASFSLSISPYARDASESSDQVNETKTMRLPLNSAALQTGRWIASAGQ